MSPVEQPYRDVMSAQQDGFVTFAETKSKIFPSNKNSSQIYLIGCNVIYILTESCCLHLKCKEFIMLLWISPK